MERQPTAGGREPERRSGPRRFQDLIRLLEKHREAQTEVGEEMLAELIRRGIRIPSEATILDLMSLVIDAETPYLRTLTAERRQADRRRN